LNDTEWSGDNMPKPVKIAQVGCGSVAQRGTLAHLALDDVKGRVRLVATMDPVAERARACMEKFEAEEWYDDYDRMLAEADIDAVTIASPIGVHYEQVMKAIASGKHVHCNKTITTTAKEATDIIEGAKKRGIKVVSSPGNSARQPAVRRTKNLIKEGIIGKVYMAQRGGGFSGHEYEGFRSPDNIVASVDPAWYYKKDGGPMYDYGVYLLHEVTAILGPAKNVTAMSGIGLKERVFKGKKIPVEMDDNTLLLLDFGESTFAYLFATFSVYLDGCPLSISGSEGAIRVTEHGRLEVMSNRIPKGRRTEELSYEGTLPYVEQLGLAHTAWRLPPRERESMRKSLGLEALPEETHVFDDVMHLVHCIENDVEPIVVDNIESMQHARHVIEIIEKGYIAAKTGRTQKLTTIF